MSASTLHLLAQSAGGRRPASPGLRQKSCHCCSVPSQLPFLTIEVISLLRNAPSSHFRHPQLDIYAAIVMSHQSILRKFLLYSALGA